MANGVKYRRKVSAVIFNKIVVRMAMCIRLTYVRLSIQSTHCHESTFSWSIKFSVDQIFILHRLNGNIFWVSRQYTWYVKIERYGSLVVALSDFAWAPLGCGGRRKGTVNFFLSVLDFGIESIHQSAKLNWIMITFQVEIVTLKPCV